ncbi:uncharacterized protein LOC120288732 [Eucalyptus grandis]|uniref:uncharacterized protein LOC120288732 n=1 Tax=Eucalyptus grandis TaxID=71139 RepID=UPI00192EAADE|nr:uncharacterized protein LOC120288732 [Eucalyptus grandis]
MSDREPRTLGERTLSSVTRARTPTRGSTRGGRGRAQAEASASGVAPPPVPPVDAGVAAPGDPRFEGIMQLQPPKFTGTGDPEAATRWIEGLEKAFELLKCSEEEKVTLAVYQMQEVASTWWKATRREVFPEGVVPEWNVFVRAFNNKYFSSCAKQLKMAEFLHLRQGPMTVDQYEAKFAELSQYAPRLIQDPEEKAMRFIDGLRPELKDPLVPFDIKNYNELYGRAR